MVSKQDQGWRFWAGAFVLAVVVMFFLLLLSCFAPNPY
jgi:hypothetical protein